MEIRIPLIDTTAIEKATIKDGKLQIMPHVYWKQFDLNALLNFMYKNAFYILPTTELIEWLKPIILAPAIDIAAGNGFLGRALGIPITDSKMQARSDIKLMMYAMGQPIVNYPDDVEELEGVDAIKKYKPATIIGSYVTLRYNDELKIGNYWGIDEQFIIKNCKRYIMIGNKTVDAHFMNPIMKLPHDEYYFDWLITRSANQEAGRIFVWNQ